MSVAQKNATQNAAVTDVVAGTILISVGLVGLLVRLGVLNLTHAPQWSAMEQWWPLLLIIVGLVVWLADMEQSEAAARSGRSVEIRYGK
jgi:hypothetical protein